MADETPETPEEMPVPEDTSASEAEGSSADENEAQAPDATTSEADASSEPQPDEEAAATAAEEEQQEPAAVPSPPLDPNQVACQLQHQVAAERNEEGRGVALPLDPQLCPLGGRERKAGRNLRASASLKSPEGKGFDLLHRKASPGAEPQCPSRG